MFYVIERGERMIRPVDIARKLNISTSVLRHYESWGIVPPPKRKPNGYRVYDELHVAYFECIRAMYPGFGMGVVRKIMPLIQQNKITDALWIVNEAQSLLHRERKKAEQALKIMEMENPEAILAHNKKEWFTIGEVAKEIDVPGSTLRHWEKEGLIQPKRDKQNGYRKYNRADIYKLLVIRTLRSTAYSLETVREIMKHFDHRRLAHARKIAKNSLVHMDYLIMEQLRGMHYLYRLCTKVNLQGMRFINRNKKNNKIWKKGD
jgi:DNA-binding transcriptional MerR regulator